jgi:hypothetical protein
MPDSSIQKIIGKTFEDVREITNQRNEPITVWIEPWARDYELKPGETLRVVGRSVKDGRLEVVEYIDRIGVYEWPRASMHIFRGDELVEELEGFDDDGPPSGMSIRSFIENAFGGPGVPAASTSQLLNTPSTQFKLGHFWKAVLFVSAIIALLLGLMA